MMRAIAVLGLLASVVTLPDDTAVAAAADPRTLTIPALREWVAGSSSYTFGAGSRIVLPVADEAALGEEAAVLADDLVALTGVRPAVVVGTPGPGDLQLVLGSSDTELGDQGYRLEVSAVVTVSGRTDVGVFHGTRSVLQLLKHSLTIGGGVARDWPRYAERGVMIDTVPRKYGIDWWRNLIRDLAYLRMNELTVIAVGQGLSDAELAVLGPFSRRYKVNITPAVGMPSHADSLVAERPEFTVDPDGPNPLVRSAFDFTRPGALDFARTWIERHIDKYPGRYWHTGGDEFLKYPFDASPTWNDYPQFRQFAIDRTGNPNATGPDAYIWFINWVNGVTKAHGKALRVWNDQLERTGVVRLDRDIVVDYWIPPAHGQFLTPQELADPTGPYGGHKVVNASESRLYHDNGWRPIDPRVIHEQFDVYQFDRGQQVTGAAQANIQGVRAQAWMYHVPGKPNESNEELFEYLKAPLRSLAQAGWESQTPLPAYDDFRELVTRLGNAPGWVHTGGSIAGDPVVIRDVNGKLTYFVRRVGGEVEHRWQRVAGQAFDPEVAVLAADTAGRPAVAADRSGRLVLLVRKTDGSLVCRAQSTPGGSWAAPVVIGGGLAGDPQVLYDGNGLLTWFARSTDGRLLHGWQRDPLGPWSGPITLTSGLVGSPSVIVDVNGKSTYFVRLTNGALRHGWQVSRGGAWSQEWADLAAGTAGEPEVANDVNGRLTYFVRTTSGQLLHGWQSTAGNGPWQNVPIASGLAGDPAVIRDSQGKLTYFVRTTGRTVLHGWQSTPGNGPWQSGTLTGDVAGDPVVALDNQARIALFVRRNDNALIHMHQTVPSGGWTGALFLLGSFAGNAGVATDVNGKLTYFVRTPFGYLLHGWQEPAGSDTWDRTTLHGTVP